MASRPYRDMKNISLCILHQADEQLLQELYAVEINAHAHPWTLDGIRECFADNCIVTAMYCKHELIGFAVLALIFDEAELFTIGLKRAYQGQGLGTKLLDFTLQEGRKRGAKKCFLEVREHNHAAYALYVSFSFEVTGIRKNYYPPCKGMPAENALTMCALL